MALADGRAPAIRTGSMDEAMRVLRMREAFLSGGTPVHGCVSELVVESWRRCRDKRVDPGLPAAPVDAAYLEVAQREQGALLDAARPVLRDMEDSLADAGAMVLLCNGAGVILQACGAPATRDAGAEVNIVPGGIWAEGAAGTNAVGMAIALDRPAVIRNVEHYCDAVTRWSCVASPIHDPLDGRLIGVLDLSHCEQVFDDYARSLVLSSSKRIEQALDCARLRSETMLVEAYLEHSARQGSDGVLLLDRQGRLLRSNEHALEALRAYGVELALRRGMALGGEWQAQGVWRPPAWLQPDWVRPIFQGQDYVGMLVRIPRLLRRAPAGVGAPCESTAMAPEPDTLDPRLRGHRGAAMRKAAMQALRVAVVDVPVLLQGETGTGKEIMAQAIHRASKRAGKPFIAVNCGAIPRELLASELFGYVEGAFTGARRGGQAGKFEQADGGTLFLDELGELPLDLQPYLLRVLEDGKVTRLGSDKPRAVNVRIVAATNRDLRSAMEEGRFRSDLYFRFRVGIHLPPLRERREDLDRYIDNALAEVAQRHGIVKTVSAALRAFLHGYDFPGNLRELHNLIEQMAVMSDGGELGLEHLPEHLHAAQVTCAAPPSGMAPSMAPSAAPGMLKEIEWRTIVEALRLEQGNRSRTARRLGISRTTLYRRLVGGEHAL